MFTSEKLVYLELQKTGCSHIRKLLLNTVDGKLSGIHNSLKTKPKDKVVVASVRDPWEWYVSLWSFGCMKNAGVRSYLAPPRDHASYILRMIRRRKLDTVKGCGRLYNNIVVKIFRDYYRYFYWNNLYSDVRDVRKFRKWLHQILVDKKTHLPEIFKESPLFSYTGFYTFRYFRVLYPFDVKKNVNKNKTLAQLKQYDAKNCPVDIFLRNESLATDFVSMLQSTGHKVDDTMKNYIYSLSRTNTSKHLPYEQYYDEFSMELVRKNEEFIIDKFGYQAPKAS